MKNVFNVNFSTFITPKREKPRDRVPLTVQRYVLNRSQMVVTTTINK